MIQLTCVEAGEKKRVLSPRASKNVIAQRSETQPSIRRGAAHGGKKARLGCLFVLLDILLTKNLEKTNQKKKEILFFCFSSVAFERYRKRAELCYNRNVHEGKHVSTSSSVSAFDTCVHLQVDRQREGKRGRERTERAYTRACQEREEGARAGCLWFFARAISVEV